MERQGKMELAAKERESQRLQQIPKKWNRREEYEFLRVLTGYGVDLQPPTSLGIVLTPDWTKFKQMAHLERKSDETLSDYYRVFVAMCKRKTGVKLNENERDLEGIIDAISEDHAKLILERLELLSKLREVARHPQLEERLKLCQMNADTPDWWEPGKHDKELIAAVLKHGLYRSETFIFNDPNFSFAESEKRFIRELEAQIQRSIKLESFNAERLPASIPILKGEIIDLDDELLTKDSLIKKEQFTPVKTEVKAEPMAENGEKLSTTKSELEASASETCTASAAQVSKNADEHSELNEDRKSNVDQTVNSEKAAQDVAKDLVAANKDADVIHEIPDDDPEIETLSAHDKCSEVVSSETFSNVATEPTADAVSKDEYEKMDVDENTVVEKNTSITADADGEQSKEVTSNEFDGLAETEDSTADKSEISEKVEITPFVERESNVENDNDKKAISSAIESEKNRTAESQDIVIAQDDEANKDTSASAVSNADVEDVKSSKVDELPTEEESRVKPPTAEKSKLTAGREIPNLAVTDTGVTDPDDEEIMKEKEKAVEEECKKQAAELKARFPDLEVIQPATVKQKQDKPKLEMCMIRWFKDFALERRISHIVICIETNKWPVNRNYTAFAGCKGIDLNICLHEAIPHLKNIERTPTTPDVITITTEQGVTKQLQASQMQQVAGTVPAPTVPATNPPVVNANIAGLGLLPPPAAVAGINGPLKSIGNMAAPPLDANSINAAVAAAVAAAAAGNNPNSLSANTLSALLPGMTMTPATAAAAASLNNTPVVSQTANMPSTAPSPLPPVTQSTGKKRKRHIAIDVETERAKLHALLNSSQNSE